MSVCRDALLSVMARRRDRFAWWAGIAVLGASAVYAGTWRMWALTVLAWSLYELCLCPTTCAVAVRGGRPCHRAARGRLFACTEIETHQQLKTDALWRFTGSRARATYADGMAPAHRKAPPTAAPDEQGTVAPRQRLLVYVAVISVIATMVQTAVGLAAL
jgi:hypothetical protein